MTVEEVAEKVLRWQKSGNNCDAAATDDLCILQIVVVVVVVDGDGGGGDADVEESGALPCHDSQETADLSREHNDGREATVLVNFVTAFDHRKNLD